MTVTSPLLPATLRKRYQRFLADVRLADGSEITVHCPNTGSMKNCVLGREQAALISDSGNPARKYRYTLEAVEVAHGHWAGVNTGRANRLVEELIASRRVPGLNPADGLEREVSFKDSRFDLALGPRTEPHTFVEVKNATLGPGPAEPDTGLVTFPDAVTQRGQKHLRTLMEAAASGRRAVLFFCVQHTGATAFAPADEMDPMYGRLLREARAAGVEVLAWKAAISLTGIELVAPLPLAF